MSILDLGKEYLWRTILLLKNMMLLRTNKFVQESNRGPIKDKVFYIISTCFLLSATVIAVKANIIPTNLLLSDPTMPVQFVGGPIVVALPIFITALFSFFVSRRMNMFAIVNLHLMSSLMMCIFISLIFILPLTSRTMYADYELMKAGQGQGTEAFGMTCGNLERRAEQLFLESKMFLALPTGAPPSPALSPEANERVSQNVPNFSRYYNDTYRSQTYVDYFRIIQLDRQIVDARVSAREKYRTIFLSFGLSLIIYGLSILFITVTHSYKIILISSEGKVSKAYAHIAAASSIVVMTLSVICIYSLYNSSEEFDASKILNDTYERNRFSKLKRDDLDLRINLLHVKFNEYSVICPNINRYALW